MKFRVQILAETKKKALGDFFPSVLILVGKITWYVLLVGGDMYSVVLVECAQDGLESTIMKIIFLEMGRKTKLTSFILFST